MGYQMSKVMSIEQACIDLWGQANEGRGALTDLENEPANCISPG